MHPIGPLGASISTKAAMPLFWTKLEIKMDPAVVGVFIPIAFFVALAIVIWLVAYFRFRTRSDMQQTVRLALEKGTELGPEVLERLSGPKPDQNKDIRSAVIWIASAFGLVGLAFGIGQEESEVIPIFLGISAFPLAIGLGYLTIWRFGRDKG